jgi:hypothetical protein
MDADFQAGFAANFAEALRLSGQTVAINGLGTPSTQPTTMSALLDDSTGQTTLMRGGLEEQQIVTVTVWRSDFTNAIQSKPQRQLTVEVAPDYHLMVNEIRDNRVLPYVVLECVRYRK